MSNAFGSICGNMDRFIQNFTIWLDYQILGAYNAVHLRLHYHGKGM